MAATLPAREQTARRLLGIAATFGVLGVAFNLNNDDQLMPKLVVLAGLVGLVYSLHRFGRLGPDETIVFDEPDEARAPKKKKKKRAAAASASEGLAAASAPGSAAAAGPVPDEAASKPTPDEPDAS